MDNENRLTVVWVFQVVKRYLIGIILAGVVGGGIVYGVSRLVLKKQYTVESALLVSSDKSLSLAAQLAGQGANEKIVTTYKDIIIQPAILNTVSDELAVKYGYNLSLSELSRKIVVRNKPNSQVFTIQVTDHDARRAQRIDNEVARTFKAKIGDIMSVQGVTILGYASVPKRPSGPNYQLLTLVGVFFSFLFALAFAFIREQMDRTIKHSTYISDTLGLINLGNINISQKVMTLKGYKQTQHEKMK
ncbi:hypothetical protein H9L19_02560 [Weissella diestrammenae]|uniref:Capsular polysaccharide biosynthesis protein CpsC n=1 Tax=Weissella diestrammenae TaxID=1162633 RepID=A0A7G9T6N9_9LACO|nr:hypothetical protein [Weissella diestrammenae]MCM0582951.1 hypothetical protein [Weissella diestrammenae]QNN75764.1 hypothetical protein H9L19_02560 [Weissella diestrammenae]